MGACIIHIWHELSYRNKTNKPGEAQTDFGTADFYENGRLHHEAKYLVLSFPYSNGGFFQLNYGENMECLLEGLVIWTSIMLERMSSYMEALESAKQCCQY